MRKILIVIALLFVAACGSQPRIGPVGSVHSHAGLKVYLEGQELDLSQQKYMVRQPWVHVEDMRGDIVHVHATGVTVGEFFRTLGMKFTDECFKLDSGKEYCTEGDKTLKFYVDGTPNTDFDKYLFGPHDKILISYGSETEEELKAQLDSVTSAAEVLG